MYVIRKMRDNIIKDLFMNVSVLMNCQNIIIKDIDPQLTTTCKYFSFLYLINIVTYHLELLNGDQKTYDMMKYVRNDIVIVTSNMLILSFFVVKIFEWIGRRI